MSATNMEAARLDTIRGLLAQRQEQIAGATTLKEVEQVLNEVLFETRRDYRTASLVESVKSKADLKTAREKSAYISTYGADAYLSLPATA
jgi:hypothetical protein